MKFWWSPKTKKSIVISLSLVMTHHDWIAWILITVKPIIICKVEIWFKWVFIQIFKSIKSSKLLNIQILKSNCIKKLIHIFLSGALSESSIIAFKYIQAKVNFFFFIIIYYLTYSWLVFNFLNSRAQIILKDCSIYFIFW